ncbi:MAG: hypothetical protein MAGBODY4_00336 [Candidatus Marinimicrobia bacterium]|nr:hypothetical protein [Candidatus Neomarinimicrobiota bacterium]
MSGVTDPYQPVERDLQITRRCLEVLNECNNPVAIITKNHLITRDIDILSELANRQAVSVHVSITTLDNDLRRFLEPRTSHIDKRLKAIRELSKTGIPCGTLVAPVIPGMTEHEIPGILRAADNVGAGFAGYIVLRLPYNLKYQFREWLEQHYPDRKGKVLNRIRAMRDGKLNDTEFGKRMSGEGIYADQIRELFRMGIEKTGLETSGPSLSTEAFRRPEIDGQMRMF